MERHTFDVRPCRGPWYRVEAELWQAILWRVGGARVAPARDAGPYSTRHASWRRRAREVIDARRR